MGLFRKNPDPISNRSRELNAKISALESKIKKLAEEIEPGPNDKGRAQANGRNAPLDGSAENRTARGGDPIFEKVDQNQLKTSAGGTPAPPPTSKELGVRKSDFWSLLDRMRKQLQSPPAANPKLVNYLAAGSIQGLRPLRYEKRIARNRCIVLAALLLLAFLGIYLALQHRR